MVFIITFSVFTLGCRVNQYESEAISEELCRNGLSAVPFNEGGDIIIINTCAVTSESVRKARQYIRRARKASPDAYIIVTGCAVQISPEDTEKLSCADALIGNRNKRDVCRAALDFAHTAIKKHISSVPSLNDADFEPLCTSTPERKRAYIKIEDGCDNKCAYCIIPIARGPVRSKPPEEIISEAASLARSGCRELILTGIEISAYSFDFASLLLSLDAIPGIERIRFGSLEPSFASPEFCDAISKAKHVMPHFHLSIQSGCSKTLAAMRRRYNAETALNNIRYMYKVIPGLCLSADVIVGFPGETEKDFTDTLDFVISARFLHLHIFPYSRRPGTEASDMPGQISETEKAKRAACLSECGNKIKLEILNERIASNNPLLLLAESSKDGLIFGHSESFIDLYLPDNGTVSPGDIVRVTPNKLQQDGILCSPM